MSAFWKKTSTCLWFSLLAGLGITALVVALDNGGWNTLAWLLFGILVSLLLFLLALAVRWAGSAKPLVWIVVIGLVLRLAVSVGLTLGLPVYGYENEEHQAGYIFADSYDRDLQAWSLADSDNAIITAFENQYLADQYGGLLSIMALQYRYLSTDAHRQMLPLLVSIIVFTLSIPFLWKAFQERWNHRVALVAALVLSFYPEAVLLSSAHMREPFLICLTSIATWAVLAWQKNWLRSAVVLLGCILGLALISWRSGVVISGVLLVWLVVDVLMEHWQPSRRKWGWLLVLAICAVFIVLSYPWIRETAVFDTYNTVQSSGIMQYIFKHIGHRFQLPVVTVYGLSQPLLPAALVAISNPLASVIAILRSLGWYLLAPALVFGFVVSWKAQPERDRRLLIWLTMVCLFWTVVSSYRAGGDLWDNPRYRTIFLPWLALIAGWVWDWARRTKNPWLWRLYLIELLFVLIFTDFYLVRIAHFGIPLSLPVTVGLVILIGVIVLGSGFFLDWRSRRKRDGS
jgi:hypothetical protein